MIIYKKNKKLLEDNNIYNSSMEHDACGVGMVASTDGKKYRKIVEHGIEALKAIWHRGAVDADGKSGDGAGIQLEIAPKFFKGSIILFMSRFDRDLSPVIFIFFGDLSKVAHRSLAAVPELPALIVV